jgi:ABC-type nitrate/sulfonate/bicarbonate transport system substrate-binding protein
MRRWALLALLFPLLGAPTADYLSAKRKFDLIESEKLRPGSRVMLTPRELNAYVANEVEPYAAQGVRETKLELGDGWASGTALIDFLKLQQGAGKPPGWLMSKLLAGERPVRVKARIQSGAGLATVDVESVEISGVVVDGKMLDYLIQHYLIAQFPNAKVGRPFELEHRIDRLDVKPNAVGVILH